MALRPAGAPHHRTGTRHGHLAPAVQRGHGDLHRDHHVHRGLGATISALWVVFADFPLLLLALLGNLAVIPLFGRGLADLLGLPTASFIAPVLVASPPGGPFGGS
ncbi:hypothetical protein ACFY2M_44745 [Streptomyces sp. NPDC001276]|uniref:hypothetical protein n=1 Tax=Streptomyces sp. NPDC001276 TaxID=3364555 RepID=UPI00368F9147